MIKFSLIGYDRFKSMVDRDLHSLTFRYGMPVTPSGIVCISKSPTLMRRPMQYILWLCQVSAPSCFAMLKLRSRHVEDCRRVPHQQCHVLLTLSDALLVSLPSCLSVTLCLGLAIRCTDDTAADDDDVTARLEDQLSWCVVLLA
jgi:hypothetical protein